MKREGRAHNHRERQRLGEELELERVAHLGDQRNVRRLELDLQERQQTLKAPKKSLWTNLSRSNNHKGPNGGLLRVTRTPFEMRRVGSALACYTPHSTK